MAKAVASVYRPGRRSPAWKKIKPGVSVGLEVVHFFGLDPAKPTLVSIGQSAAEGTGVARKVAGRCRWTGRSRGDTSSIGGVIWRGVATKGKASRRELHLASET